MLDSYSVEMVANSILKRDLEDGHSSITPMKLQKLVYFFYGWYLAITGENVLEDGFEAWQYGPVHRNLYHMFKQYGNDPIDRCMQEWTGSRNEVLSVPREGNEVFWKILDVVIDKYMHLTASQLSAMTHKKGTPWYTAHKEQRIEISDDEIKEYFDGMVK